MNILDCAADGSQASTVFIVDDDPRVRRTICHVLQSSGLADRDFSSAQEFLDYYDGTAGCLILDIRMPEMSGLDLQRQLQLRHICLPILFLTGCGEIPSVTQAMRGGAVDVIAKPFKSADLLAKVGEAIRIDSANRCKHAQAEEVNARIATLTQREDEIMRLLASGTSTKEIAHRLEISSKTADKHRAKVLEKMRVDNPTQLANQLLRVTSGPPFYRSVPPLN